MIRDRFKFGLSSILIIVFFWSCSDFMDEEPKGVLSEEEASNPENVDGLVNASYSALGNDHWETPFSLWPFGNVRSDDAYKGGSGTNDAQPFHFLEVSNNIRPSQGEWDDIWYLMYVGISRTNKAIGALNEIEEEEYSKKKERIAEMKFVRGHFYFMLKILFNKIPYVEEGIPIEEYDSISNVALSNNQLWDTIANNFESASKDLPSVQDDHGRPTNTAAYAYLAKTRLYQAYEQDDDYSVSNINSVTLEKVIEAANEVIGKSSLETDFGNNFMPGTEYENGKEALFSIQFSQDDNTRYGRLNFADEMALPQGLGCCDFHKPSQDLVNSFKTDEEGLPIFEDYNESDLESENLDQNTVDPRLYHTVAIPGLPWKYEEEEIFKEDWNRSPDTYGTYASLKENVPIGCDCTVNIDPFYANSKNRIEIRYADVLLFKAEALIELGRQDDALPLINEVRSRAKNSLEFTGDYTSNNYIEEYKPGENCQWTQEFARKALRWERRLEFAMEGSRFFDLVRWGIAESTLEDYYNIEQNKRSYYNEASFNQGVNEYLPIPLNQIDFSKGIYEQNNGY